ncbi:MAG: serine/threonine protein kinase [Acidobacteria bacterium]|nr:serine/threonine protein kinase [Acidobacteriota bacterium]
MSLGPGTRLGPYEILAAIGAGGMGEVYKARDTRLNRTVALKVLPEHVRDNPEFKQRFEREARAIAALEHPHICVLHDIGHDGGIDFLVMEYLEGQTLSRRLEKSPLSFDQALQYAIQIADALDKAHRAGITHRDLKPSNIMRGASGEPCPFGHGSVQQHVHRQPQWHAALRPRRAERRTAISLGHSERLGGVTSSRTPGNVLRSTALARRKTAGNHSNR